MNAFKDQHLKRTILKKEIESHHLKHNRTLRIYLPPGYNELSSYPVIYCQDGEQFFNFGRIATQMSQLILDEGLEPMIIVGVEVDTSIRTEEYSPDGELHERYTSFFVEELLPYMEENFPVRTNKEDRILAGDSLGGTVSLQLALNYPELFTKVLSLSGAFLEPTYKKIESLDDLTALSIYMFIGLGENEVKTSTGTYDFLTANRHTRDLLEDRGANIHYVEKEGTHIWRFWQPEIPDGIRFLV